MGRVGGTRSGALPLPLLLFLFLLLFLLLPPRSRPPLLPPILPPDPAHGAILAILTQPERSPTAATFQARRP